MTAKCWRSNPFLLVRLPTVVHNQCMNINKKNRIARLVGKLRSLPMGQSLISMAMGRMIPFVGTSGLEILEISDEILRVRIKNRSKIRNHIGQVHAAAMMLLGETATGLVVGMNVSDDSLPLLKEMKTKFVKRSQGDMVAIARIPLEQKYLFQAEKGEISVHVEVRDETGIEPVLIEALWAWVPKKNPSK